MCFRLELAAKTLLALLSLALLSICWPPHAAAGVWSVDKGLNTAHPVYIYVPDTTLKIHNPLSNENRRALLIVLHGCDQKALQLVFFGNLEGAADKFGFVVAVPDLGDDAWKVTIPEDGAKSEIKCWDYDQTADRHQHIQQIIQLSLALLARPDLHIHPSHVYISGLSSGGTVSMEVGCAAPDIFAGVAAIAAPSIGTYQVDATKPWSAILELHLKNATRYCRALPERYPHLPPGVQSQPTRSAHEAPSYPIIHLSVGELDKDGHSATAGCARRHAFDTFVNPGREPVVSVRWLDINAAMFADLFLGESKSIELGRARTDSLTPMLSALLGSFVDDELTDENDGKNLVFRRKFPKTSEAVRVEELCIRNVGHAWPAGQKISTGYKVPLDWVKPAPGDFIATDGLNYPSYIMNWFLHNNARVK